MRPASTTPHPDVSSSLTPRPERFTRDELLGTSDWSELTERLLGYAQWRVSRHGAAAASYAFQPADLVQEAIALVLEDRRRFVEGTPHEFFAFLCGVIKSLLSHDAERTAQRGKMISISKDGGDEQNNDEMTEGRIAAREDFEHELLFRDDIQGFIRSLDPELAAYARLFLDDPESSAADRATMFSTTVTEIRNLDRRLHRAAAHWRMKQCT
jgi:DNA-directed RNA polymerase specialized sigma24 family protein